MSNIYTITLFLFGWMLIGVLSLNAQNVGIGQTNPASRLDINGGLTIGSSYSGVNAAPSNGLLVQGAVGIGVTAPGSAKLNVLNTTGYGVQGSTNQATFSGLFGINTSTSGTGIVGFGSNKTTSLPATGAGGFFFGETGVYAITDDSIGIAMYAENMNAGLAARFVGDFDLEGVLANSSTVYGSSVAVDDGITVGNITGNFCAFDSLDFCSFAGSPQFGYFLDYSPTYDNIFSCGKGQCRSITNLSFEASFFDASGFPIDVDVYVRDEYLGSMFIADAGDATHTYVIDTDVLNGLDPDSLNFYVYVRNQGGDSDYWETYSGIVDYEFGDSSNLGSYAAYGEVRASGKLYANMTSEYGDVAEYFEVLPRGSYVPQPGDIVSIATDIEQAFELTTEASDNLMAGVISENPSVLLNDPSEGSPIALTGRIKVKVNVEGGVIKPGDAITSSSIPGVGKKTEQGIILGHALEAFDGSRTNEGKIWILLGKTALKNVDDNKIAIIEDKEVDLGGMEINGFVSLDSKSSNYLNITWGEKVEGRITDDIEFQDLVIDLTQVGGDAQYFVKEVNQEGVIIELTSSSKGFKGFYYSINMVSPELLNNRKDESYTIPEDYDERLNLASTIYNKRTKLMEKLIMLSGADPKKIENVTPANKKTVKTAIASQWKKADKATYIQYLAMGKHLDALVSKDPHFMADLSRATE